MQSIIRYAASTLVLLALSPAARAETTDCIEITGLPYAITAPGIYCLKRSLAVSGSGVFIESNDVVFDLNGHALVMNLAVGVGVQSSNRSNVTVRNGTIRGGEYGVSLDGVASHGNLVERLRVLDAAGVGIAVAGRGHVVRNNVLIGIGRAGPGANFGISATSGAGIRISGNQVIDMDPTSPGESDAIRVVSAPGAVIEHNLIGNSTASNSATGILIFSFPGTTGMKATVVGNRVVNMQIGIDDHAGPNGTASSLFLDNTVGGAALPFRGGIMPANSNFSF